MNEALNLVSLKRLFDRDGFISIPGFFNPSEMADINMVLEKVIREQVPGMPSKHAFYEDKNDAGSLKQLQDLHIYEPYFQRLLTGGRIEHLTQVLLEEKVIGKNLQYFNKPAQIGKPTPPHQDGYYFKLEPPTAATVWLALEDVDEENGCVRYIKGSHLRGMRPHGRSNILGFSQGISDYSEADKAAEINLPAKAGDLLVHHALTIHRADGNQSINRSRKALGFVYFATSAIEDVVAKEAYLKELEKNFL